MKATLYQDLSDPQLASDLLEGKIGVIPTDTQYGIVASALNPEAVERVYAARRRDLDKPCIVLVASFDSLLELDGLDRNTILMAEKYWPGKVSVDVSCVKSKFPYLHRGTGRLAVRIPDYPELRTLLEATGPIIAPSANLQNEQPAETMDQAQSYFGDSVDFYVNVGALINRKPSTIISFTEDGFAVTHREGAVKISETGEIV